MVRHAAMQWEEWGCPKDKEYYEYMKGYSPVDNIQRAAYPHILVTAGAHSDCHGPLIFILVRGLSACSLLDCKESKARCLARL